MMYGLYALAARGEIAAGTRVVAVITGLICDRDPIPVATRSRPIWPSLWARWR
jgi:hypothetical protein